MYNLIVLSSHLKEQQSFAYSEDYEETLCECKVMSDFKYKFM
jgi:hypothetical protein